MKTTLLYVCLFLATTTMLSQTAYVQVNGEPGLEVYLNGNFKGKTTAEYNGLIIENVKAGKNLIKIVKAGYTPYEEYVTIKAGEVFAYKVKPFTKHLVQISQQGNTGATTEKATLETGKLVIQSVPIEIKITMPDIEGIKNSPKTKDEWLADKIPVGSYTITFAFNQKVITKTISIDADNTTSVFVNMLNEDFKVNRTLFEEVQLKKDEESLKRTIDSLMKTYKFKRGLLISEFRNYNREAAEMIEFYGGQSHDGKAGKPRKTRTPGPYTYSYYYYRPIYMYNYIIKGEPHTDAEVLAFYNEQIAYYKRILPTKYINILSPDYFYFYDSSENFKIGFSFHQAGSSKQDKYSYVEIIFQDLKSYEKSSYKY